MTQTVPSLTLRAYKCLGAACGIVFQAVPSSSIRCTKCGGAQIKRVTLDTAAAPSTAKAVTPPAIATPTIPKPPTTPPPTLRQAPPAKGAVKSLAQQLQESKVGVFDAATGARTINRDTLDHTAYDRVWNMASATLPAASPEAEVAALIRHVANNAKATSIQSVTISFLMPVPFLGPGRREWTLANRVVLDLSLPLREMARGICRPLEHANTNTAFGNFERLLPEYVQGERVTYREFGWRYPIPASAKGFTTPPKFRPESRKTTLKVAGADEGTQVFLAKNVAEDGNTVDAGLRLIISDWGYLFLTTDHYRSFRIYDPVHEQWRAYGESKNAHASWYHRGEPEAAALIPVSAPRFW